MKRSRIEQLIRQTRDPWYTRFKEGIWNRYVVCRIKGHDEVRKMGGTTLCSRCTWASHWR